MTSRTLAISPSRFASRNTLASIAVAGIGAGVYFRYAMTEASADSGAPPRAFGSGPAFLSLKLESSEAVNHNTKKLRFQLPQPDAVSGLGLTSALLTYSWPKGCLLPCVRPYTPVSNLEEPGILEFLVKHYPGGKQSTHLHSLQPGDTLRFVTPIPGFKWSSSSSSSSPTQPQKLSDITLIAGGAGITPMYQLIRGILDSPPPSSNNRDTDTKTKTKITLVFGVNTDADVLLKSEFEAYEREFPDRFRAVYTVSNPEPNSPYRRGYVTKELLQEIGIAPAEKGDTTKVFVCGPPAMENALVGGWSSSGVLRELGYSKSQIHKF